MDRQTATTHLAKVLAFVACGHAAKARPHAAALIAWLQSL
jgi:hypothetical protein